jgi:uncharacterized protein (DUF885 family)
MEQEVEASGRTSPDFSSQVATALANQALAALAQLARALAAQQACSAANDNCVQPSPPGLSPA